MKQPVSFVLSLALVALIRLSSANAQAAPAPLECVQVSGAQDTTIIDVASGRTTTLYHSLPSTGIPFQPFGYDPEGNKQSYLQSSADGRYSAELISTDQPFMRGDYGTPLNNRLLVRDSVTGHFYLFPEQEVASVYWSPDGKQIAYLWGIDGQFDLVIANPDGTNSRSIRLPFLLNAVEFPFYDPSWTGDRIHWNAGTYPFFDVTWSADTDYLAFMSQSSKQFSFLSVKDMRFVLTVPLTTPPQDYERGWSPQGDDFAYWDWAPGLTSVTLSIISVPDGTVKQHISVASDAFFPGLYMPGELDWSANGQYLASIYTANVPGDFISDGILDLYSLDGRQWHGKDTFVYWSLEWPNWSSGWPDWTHGSPEKGWSLDSKAYVAVQNKQIVPVGQYSYGNLVAFLTDTDTFKTIATKVVLDARNPKTGRIAYAAIQNVNSGSDMLISTITVNANGTQPVTLSHDVNLIDSLSWSPDGQYVVTSGIITSNNPNNPVYDPNYVDRGQGGPTYPPVYAKDSQLVWASADGSQVHTLHYQMVHVLQWLPSKDAVMYIVEQNNTFAVMMLDLVSGQSRALVSGLTEDKYRFTQPGSDYVNEWTAFPLSDGKHLVLRYGWSRQAYGLRYWNQGLYLTTWDGQDTHELIPASETVSYNTFTISDVLPSPDGAAAVISVLNPAGPFQLLLLGHEGQSTIINLDLTNGSDSLRFAWTDCSF